MFITEALFCPNLNQNLLLQIKFKNIKETELKYYFDSAVLT